MQRRDDKTDRARLLELAALLPSERADAAGLTDRGLAMRLLAAAGFDPTEARFATRSDAFVIAFAVTPDGAVAARLQRQARADEADPIDPELAAEQAETAKAREAMIKRNHTAWTQPSRYADPSDLAIEGKMKMLAKGGAVGIRTGRSPEQVQTQPRNARERQMLERAKQEQAVERELEKGKRR